MEVPVTKEAYEEYYRFKWREENWERACLKHEVSLEYMTETGNELPTIHNQKLVSHIVEDKLMLELLMSALDKLTQDERLIIDEIYFNNKTERELAKKINISQPAVFKKKQRY